MRAPRFQVIAALTLPHMLVPAWLHLYMTTGAPIWSKRRCSPAAFLGSHKRDTTVLCRQLWPATPVPALDHLDSNPPQLLIALEQDSTMLRSLSHMADRSTPAPNELPATTRGMPSTAAIFGHPIHPMLIPYPVAFLTAALGTDLAAQATRDPFWGRVSKWLLGAGIVSGAAAGAVGAIDYYTIRRAREAKVGRLHAMGNPIALGLAAASLALRRGRPGGIPGPGTIGVTAGMTALLGLTAWAGAELSYRHMVGVAGHGDQHTHEEKRYVM